MTKNIKIGKNSFISSNIVFGNNVQIGNNVTLDGTGSIGDDTIMGNNISMKGDFVIGKRNIISDFVYMENRNEIGNDNKIGPFTSFGLEPQDKNFKPNSTKVIIGNKNTIREYSTVHKGTKGDTKIGNDNFIMSSSVINHDCNIGNGVILASGCILGGYVAVGDFAYLGQGVACHQQVRIGTCVFIGMNSKVARDIPPFLIVDGSPLKKKKVNSIGMKRNGFNQNSVESIVSIYKNLIVSPNKKNEIHQIEENDPADTILIKFLEEDSVRSVMWI